MVKTTQLNFKKLKSIILNNNNGFTYKFNLEKSNIKKGFYISLTNNFNTNLNKAIENLNKLFLQEFNNLNTNKLYIGGWIDKKENKFYLDFTIHIKNKENALLIARLFKQKAIWDIQNFKEIRV